MSYYLVDFSINTKKYTLNELTEIMEKRLRKKIGIPPSSFDKNFLVDVGPRKGKKRGTSSWCFYTQAGEKAAFKTHLNELRRKLDPSGLLKKGVIPKDCKLYFRVGYFSKPKNGFYESMQLDRDFTAWLGIHKINVEIVFYG